MPRFHVRRSAWAAGVAVVASAMVVMSPTEATATPAAQISAGASHTCALTVEGLVLCWGDNSYGQLRIGSTSSSAVPIEVQGLSSGVASISVGTHHACAVTSVGSVKCWGHVGDRRNDEGTLWESRVPMDVPGLASGVAAVSAGGQHTCALTAEGGVKCWGFSGFGRLGSDSERPSAVPVDVVGLSSGVLQISAGGTHVCAVRKEQDVVCWGDPATLGNGTSDPSATPVPVRFDLPGTTRPI